MTIHNRKPVLVVGGANGERILSVNQSEYAPGRKHVLEQSPPVGAGSSINHACRLLATGVEVIPIIPVLNDHTGNLIVRTLEETSKLSQKPFKFQDEWYMSPTTENETTQFTTIVNIGEERTVYSEITNNLIESYQAHYNSLIESIDPQNISAVVIGHVYADKKAFGEITKNVIQRFSRSVPIVANFGSSQYNLGKDTWANSLRDISYFQLDLHEIRCFFQDENAKLKNILEWFRDRCTVVVTLDRKGAIAQVRGSNKITFVWPYELGVLVKDFERSIPDT